MWAWLLKIIGNIIIKSIKRKIDLKKIDKYVNQPNELDKKVKKLEKELKKVKKLAHPSQEYICCRKCGCKIAKTKRVKRKLKKLKEIF